MNIEADASAPISDLDEALRALRPAYHGRLKFARAYGGANPCVKVYWEGVGPDVYPLTLECWQQLQQQRLVSGVKLPGKLSSYEFELSEHGGVMARIAWSKKEKEAEQAKK